MEEADPSLELVELAIAKAIAHRGTVYGVTPEEVQSTGPLCFTSVLSHLPGHSRESNWDIRREVDAWPMPPEGFLLVHAITEINSSP